MKVPLFPLKSIICPGGRMPLQVFEPRYLDMLSRCLREERGFIVVLLREGSETGPCDVYSIGTYVQVVDFEQLPNGLLGITAEGVSKVAILDVFRQEDGLYVGEVEWLLQEDTCSIPDEYEHLVLLLRDLLKHPMVSSMDMEIDFDDARDVGYRLTELLPLDNRDKQVLLAMVDPRERLRRLFHLVRDIEEN